MLQIVNEFREQADDLVKIYAEAFRQARERVQIDVSWSWPPVKRSGLNLLFEKSFYPYDQEVHHDEQVESQICCSPSRNGWRNIPGREHGWKSIAGRRIFRFVRYLLEVLTMKGCMLIVGLIKTVFGSDYRSEGQRIQLRRMGYEFVRESVPDFGGRTDEYHNEQS
jgi:hypothetical protein